MGGSGVQVGHTRKVTTDAKCGNRASPRPVADSIDYSDRFRVFSGAGYEISLAGLLAARAGVEVAYVGESHDDPVGHWEAARADQAPCSSASRLFSLT